MDELIKILSQYWLWWVWMWVMIYFIQRLQDISKQERDEWRAQSGKQHDEIADIAKNTYTVLSELKAMINHKK